MKALPVVLLLCSSISLAAVDHEAIRSVITGHATDVRSCMAGSEANNTSKQGKLVVDWSINDKGEVTKAVVNSGKSTLKDGSIEACVTGKFKAWKFPPAPRGQIVTASYPFVFSN